MTQRLPFISRLYWSIYLAAQLHGQSSYPYRPLAAIEQDRDRRGHEFVAYAYHDGPHYRDIFRRLRLHPSDFNGAAA